MTQCDGVSDTETLLDGEGGNVSDAEFVRRLGNEDVEATKVIHDITSGLYVPFIKDPLALCVTLLFNSEFPYFL